MGGGVPQDTDEGVGGFGLSSKEQAVPTDAVLADGSANNIRLVFLYSRLSFSSKPGMRTVFAHHGHRDHALGIITLEDIVEGACIRQAPTFHGYS